MPELTGILSLATALEANLGVQALQGDNYTLLVLTNLSPIKKNMDVKLRVNISFDNAEFTAIDGAKSVEVNGNELTVRDMTDGGILILRHCF